MERRTIVDESWWIVVVVVAFPFIVVIGYPASSTLWVLIIAITSTVFNVMFYVFLLLFPALLGLFLSICVRDHPCSGLNRPVFSIYSIVSIIFVLSPSSTLVRIPSIPTFLLSLSLSSSYNSHFSR